MPEIGRKRGRPTGSGKDDTALLNFVASKLLAKPAMKPSAAMKQVIAKTPQPITTPETLLRRLQVKWKIQAAVLMDAARARAEAEARRTRDRHARENARSYSTGHIPHSLTRHLEDIQRTVDQLLPDVGHLQKYQDMFHPTGMSAYKQMFDRHQHIQDDFNPSGISAFKK